MKNVKGFSLIELLVVVAIIGVLAAAGVVGYQNYTDTAKKNVADNNTGQILRYIKNQSGIAATGVATGECEATNIGKCGSSNSASLPGFLVTYFGSSNAAFTNPYSDGDDVVFETPTADLDADGDCTGETRGKVRVSEASGDITIHYCEGDTLGSYATQSVDWAS